MNGQMISDKGEHTTQRRKRIVFLTNGFSPYLTQYIKANSNYSKVTQNDNLDIKYL